MSSTSKTTQKPVKILVVEDSPTQLEALRFLLEESGFSVVAATNGVEGFAAAKANAIDLVISDIVMPEMDGYALCKALRAEEALRSIPVILLTSLSDPRDVIHGLESGANNFICKPYEDRALLARVQTVLANQEIRKTSSSEMGINIFFAGQRFFITADRLQILDLLLSTYENAVTHNTELTKTRDELRLLNEQLEKRVAKRTAALTAEIEERKREEENLRRMATVVRDSNDAITIQDFEGRITAWNRGAELMYGHSEEEALLMNIERLTAPEKVAEQKDFIRRLAAGEDVTSFETQRVTKDGRVLDVWMTVTKLMGNAGKPIGLASTERDITERKRVEEALRQSEEKYHGLFENAGDAIFIADAETAIILDANKMAEEMLGMPRNEIIGMNRAALHPDRAKFAAEFSLHVEAGKVTDSESVVVNRAGRHIPVRISTHTLSFGRRKVMQGVFRDITEYKRAEAEREKLEAQLRTSQKMEAIGSLAGGIAHDFNNLLSVILSYTGFAIDAVREGDPLREDLSEVKKAGERAATLVRQLLAFGRKQLLEPKPLDLNQVTAEIEKMLRRILGEDVDFVQNLAPDLGLTLADPGQIEQVLMNLVVNARDAMPEGGKLTIETANVVLDEEYAASHAAVEPGPYVMLAVTDNGSGMNEQTLARIFEPFFTTKEKGKGTGLGLSTVYGIVRQSGGDVHVYSEPGQGTTFKIYLLRMTSPVATESKPPAEPTRLTGDETILVVEDEEAVCNLAKRILGAAGYTVLTAANGGEALATCERYTGEIHLVLTDVVMPEMSGRVFAERLAKVRLGIKVLYMSGYTDDAIVHHGTLGPGTKFIGKPFNATDLARKVREVLDET